MNAENYYNGATLFGFKSLNGSKDMEGLVFKVEAFAAFLRAKGLPLPEAWQRRFNLEPHAQGTETPTKAGNPETVEPGAPKVVADDSLEIVQGVTVGELRALLDEEREGDSFRPVLLATIRAAIEIDRMRAQVPPNGSFTVTHGRKPDEVIKEKLSELECWNPNARQNRVSDADMKCVTRMLRLTYMAKNGRTKTD